MNKLEIIDPFNRQSRIIVDQNNFVIDNDNIYITIDTSNCVIVAKVINQKTLINPETEERIGELLETANCFS